MAPARTAGARPARRLVLGPGSARSTPSRVRCNYTTYVITLSVLKYRNGTYLGKVERKCYNCSYTYTSTYQYPDPAGNQSYCTVVHAFVSDALGAIQEQYQARKCEVASF